jgi:hypothetical protein
MSVVVGERADAAEPLHADVRAEQVAAANRSSTRAVL